VESFTAAYARCLSNGEQTPRPVEWCERRHGMANSRLKHQALSSKARSLEEFELERLTLQTLLKMLLVFAMVRS
jgi:hypothetical protein